MGTWDYIYLIGGILMITFTLVCDVLLIREWIKKRRDKQQPPQDPGK